MEKMSLPRPILLTQAAQPKNWQIATYHSDNWKLEKILAKGDIKAIEPVDSEPRINNAISHAK